MKPDGRPSARAADEDAALADLPEVKAKMREMMAKHYEQWLSESIRALGNKTPLEAVRDPAGREAVEALVRQAEREGRG
ncbi:MAG TPA: antitoxin Xre/MbcA/ParS toxin-binding domain-containing protein [Casimicrobiaceae bacterium]